MSLAAYTYTPAPQPFRLRGERAPAPTPEAALKAAEAAIAEACTLAPRYARRAALRALEHAQRGDLELARHWLNRAKHWATYAQTMNRAKG